MTQPDSSPGPRGGAAILLAIPILAVATNLRAPITSVGPVLTLISIDTGLSPAALGILGAVPHRLRDRLTPRAPAQSPHRDRADLAGRPGCLIAATILRSIPGGTSLLWIGTALIGCAIAVGNVLIPAVVKRDFPNKIALMTGVYAATLGTFAATASGLALPIAQRSSWRVALAVWIVLSVIAALTWLPRAVRSRPASAAPQRARPKAMWGSATAWQVTLFMGCQSLAFYFLITWLPRIEASNGIDPVTAGWHRFLYQTVGIAAGLGVTGFMHGRSNLRVVAATVSALMIVAMTGPRTQAYLRRRVAEGKTKRKAMRCLKRYIARELYPLLADPSQTAFAVV